MSLETYLSPSNLMTVIPCAGLTCRLLLHYVQEKGLAKKTNDVLEKAETLKMYIREQINQWVVVALC